MGSEFSEDFLKTMIMYFCTSNDNLSNEVFCALTLPVIKLLLYIVVDICIYGSKLKRKLWPCVQQNFLTFLQVLENTVFLNFLMRIWNHKLRF